MAEPIHGGCYDCGNMTQETLKSVTTVRTEINPKTKKASVLTNVALCDSCLAKEQTTKKGVI